MNVERTREEVEGMFAASLAERQRSRSLERVTILRAWRETMHVDALDLDVQVLRVELVPADTASKRRQHLLKLAAECSKPWQPGADWLKKLTELKAETEAAPPREEKTWVFCPSHGVKDCIVCRHRQATR